jgi:hypothetical protein
LQLLSPLLFVEVVVVIVELLLLLTLLLVVVVLLLLFMMLLLLFEIAHANLISLSLLTSRSASRRFCDFSARLVTSS